MKIMNIARIREQFSMMHAEKEGNLSKKYTELIFSDHDGLQFVVKSQF